jgi:transcriptional regulator with XRE-family HTH domain
MEDPAEALARRLRTLRTRSWPDTKITQPQLAGALGVSVPLISSWESSNAPKVPPNSRLAAYARLFCTPRSLQDGELRPLDKLTAHERAQEETLLQELTNLRKAALGEAHLVVQNPWRFPDGKTITLICAQLPPETLARMPYVEPDDPDYIELYTYADLDALFELYGHVRAFNPDSEVRHLTSKDLTPDDLTSHLVLLGGVDWNDMTAEFLDRIGLPVEQVNNWGESDGAYFSAGQKRYHPRLSKDGQLQEDIALFYRGPNPLNMKRTLTICNGMYGRGTLGVVRALTDIRFRDRNADYLHDRFGDEPAFAILTRISVLNGTVVTPDWNQTDRRAFEWPHNL